MDEMKQRYGRYTEQNTKYSESHCHLGLNLCVPGLGLSCEHVQTGEHGTAHIQYRMIEWLYHKVNTVETCTCTEGPIREMNKCWFVFLSLFSQSEKLLALGFSYTADILVLFFSVCFLFCLFFLSSTSSSSCCRSSNPKEIFFVSE